MRKFITSAIAMLALLASSFLIGPAANAASKPPVKVSYLKSVQVPLGSQDFHFIGNAQGSHFAQWVVKTTTNNVDTWQVWIADFEPYTGTLLNQTKAYELPPGTSFLAKPVMSHFPNSVGIVYSTRWEANSTIYSQVEAITFGREGYSEHQVISKFPRIEIASDAQNYNQCLSWEPKCGYIKVAVGGDAGSQTTIAALEYLGDREDARIGLTSSAYFRSIYWSDPYWLPSNTVFNFESDASFSWGNNRGVFFTYIHRELDNSVEVRKVTFNQDATQTVSDPWTISRVSGGSFPKITFLTGAKSLVTWFNTDYGKVELWGATFDTQNDFPTSDSVIWATPSTRSVSSGTYFVKRISAEGFQVVIPQNDWRFQDHWFIDSATDVTSEWGATTTATILAGNDVDTQAVLGDSYSSPDGSFGLSIKVKAGESKLGSILVYSPDFGTLPVPLKARKAAIVDSTIYGSFYDSSLLSIANLKLGTQQFIEITRLLSKLPATSTLDVSVLGGREVGQSVIVNNPGWSSFSFVGATTYQWLRCSTRIPVKIVGVPKICKKIVGANLPNYTLTAADRGKYITVTLSAQNINGASALVAASTKVVR